MQISKISSSENSTAAIGVLNAAANAAAHPAGTKAFTSFGLTLPTGRPRAW